MTCLDAQSKIIAYIDHKLNKEEKVNFLKHIKGCQDCREELGIYYTMIEGMRQLDSNQPLSKDFEKELDDRMERELKHSRKKREFFRSSVCIIILGILGFGIVGYINFLNLLHEDEQAKLKEAQGEYYFSENFHDRLFEPYDEENVLNINVDEKEPEMTFYQRVRQHNILQ